jgi:hypothetical protein
VLDAVELLHPRFMPRTGPGLASRSYNKTAGAVHVTDFGGSRAFAWQNRWERERTQVIITDYSTYWSLLQCRIQSSRQTDWGSIFASSREGRRLQASGGTY